MESIDGVGRAATPTRSDASSWRSYALGALIVVLSLLALRGAPPSLATALLHGRMLGVHLLLEFFAIVIAILVVTVSWHTLDLRRDPAANVMLGGFVVVACCDLMHAMTYREMPDFITESDPERGLFFWLMGRSVEVLTLASLALGGVPRLSRNGAVALGIAISSALVWTGSYHYDVLPRTFVEGIGLTPFKAHYEYVLCALNLGTALLLARRSVLTGSRQFRLLAMSSFVMGIGELSFTSYVSMSDFQTIAGHLFKVAAYALLYRSTYITGVRAPFEALIESEARLRESELRLRTLSDNLPHSMVYQLMMEPDGSRRFVHLSAALERLNGLKVEAVLRDATLLYRQVHPDDAAVIEAEERKAAQAMRIFEVKVRLRRADGAERTMRIVSAPRALPGGRIVWDGIETDVTEQEQAAEAQEAMQAKLLELQKMDSIGTLASGIAHDFNNVLGAIIGNARMAGDDLDRDAIAAARECLEQVTKAAVRGRSLVRQILTFSRRSPTQRQVVSLRAVVDESLNLLRASLPAGIRMLSRLPDAPVHAAIDPTQVEQVLLNLATNAWHAIGDRNGRIEIGLATVTLDEEAARALALPRARYANLWVADDGCGMDEATRSRIFEPFFTTKAPGVGTGLGLAVVHGIVRSHEGALGVTSAPSQGTRIDVYLPLAAAPTAPQDAAVPAAGEARGDGERVLYVDDDEVMSLMVERLLQRSGYDVICMRDPLRALASMRSGQDRFDVVVSDFNMPALTGLELLREMRALRIEIPVVLSSGLITDELRDSARALGVAEVLSKENTLETLPAAVRRSLAKPQAEH